MTNIPALPPGPAREELLRYFADWPKGKRLAAAKPAERTPESEKDDDDDDEERDDDKGGEPSIEIPPTSTARPGYTEHPVKTANGGSVVIGVLDLSGRRWKWSKEKDDAQWTVIFSRCRRVVAVKLLRG
jgi:hypothetical protein